MVEFVEFRVQVCLLFQAPSHDASWIRKGACSINRVLKLNVHFNQWKHCLCMSVQTMGFPTKRSSSRPFYTSFGSCVVHLLQSMQNHVPLLFGFARLKLLIMWDIMHLVPHDQLVIFWISYSKPMMFELIKKLNPCERTLSGMV